MYKGNQQYLKGRIGGSEAVVLGLSRQAKVSSQTLAKKLRNWDSRPWISYQCVSCEPLGCRTPVWDPGDSSQASA